MNDSTLKQNLARIDAAIAQWEQRLAAGEPIELEAALQAATRAAGELLRAYLAAEGRKPVPAPETELLELFKLLVKGEPSWNAIRDNLRELVYYRNCLAADRRDALPPVAEKMALRLARHLFLYVRTRAEREGRL